MPATYQFVRHLVLRNLLFVALLASLAACAAPGNPGNAVTALPPGKTMISFTELAATPAPPADHRELYGPGPLQFGELRLPARTTGRVPLVVLVHGGCWRSAYDLRHVAAAAAAIAQAGYAVWVPEYRRVGDEGGGWPGTFDDVATAVDHVRVLAGRYPTIDTARVILSGHSAGGQLVLWAASRRPGDPRLGPEAVRRSAPTPPPLRVAGIVSLAGITDLAAYGAATGSCNSAVTPLLSGTGPEVPDRYAAVSPMDRLPIGAPVRIVHGAADAIVPLAQSRTFATRAKELGTAVTLVEVPGAGHFDLVAPQSTAWPAVLDAIRSLAPSSRP
jgi:acetyl esterase/lipase